MAEGDGFDSWLSTKLSVLNPDTDLEVFVQYIRGIVEDDTPNEDKVESISGILSEITEDDLERHTTEIIKKWEQSSSAADANSNDDGGWDQKLAGILQEQKHCIVETKAVSKEQADLKAAILAQYAQVSDGEVTDEEDDDDPGAAAAADLVKNMNAQMVMNREKEQRDKDKAAVDAKRAKDKEDREKQKQKATDRKEAEKKRTAKGERRR